VLRLTRIRELHELVGVELGVSDWHDVTQDAVNAFADATGDHQWIHTDLERARSAPLGGTIAHGYYTLSLAPVLLGEVLSFDGFAMAINYGLDKLRFPAPLPVGERVRLRVRLNGVEEFRGGATLAATMTFERGGSEKPACVAEVLYRVFERDEPE
jgi:acyl dehydratase